MSTQSVLDQMTAGIMSKKAAKAATLTPVGLEKPADLPAIALVQGDVFPHDGGVTEQVVHSAREIRAELRKIAQYSEQIDECLRSIERAIGAQEGGPTVVTRASAQEQARIEQTEAERAADAAFKASEQFRLQMAEKEARAKAQIFGEAYEESKTASPSPDPTPSGGWACPEHGSDHVKTLTSRKGRVYGACLKCEEFER